MRVDTSSWGEFRIGDLFELYKGTRLTKANMIEGDVRFVSAANVNNGVTAHIGNNERVHSEGTITVCYNGNGGTGKAFYQDKPYWASDDVHVLYPKFHLPEDFKGVEWTGLNVSVGLFLATAIEKTGRQKYGFTDKWKLEYMREDKIKLPVINDGTPAWKYMDSYMDAVIKNSSCFLEPTNEVARNQKRLDSRNWKSFAIGELFTIKKGRRLTKADMIPGDTIFIGSSASNNGCTRRIGNRSHLHSPNTITVCYNESVGEAFYQEARFWASDDVNVLYPTFKLTRNIALFIVPIIRNLGKRYGYTDKWKSEAIVRDRIKLPARPDGNPDWDYMEAFMQRIILEADSTLNILSTVFDNDDMPC